MDDVIVDLRLYPKFFEAVKGHYKKGDIVTSRSCQEYIKKYYGYNVTVKSGWPIWHASFPRKDYTHFVLKWT